MDNIKTKMDKAMVRYGPDMDIMYKYVQCIYNICLCMGIHEICLRMGIHDIQMMAAYVNIIVSFASTCIRF